MARKHAGAIAEALIAAGRHPTEPAAIIANATRADQQVIAASLDTLGAAAEQSPAISIIVIGKNVRLREELDWLAAIAASATSV
jgi:uroporphyrin-III C-methyltransferase